MGRGLAKAQGRVYNYDMKDVKLASDVDFLAESLGSLPEAVARPALVVVSGLPGTGKSYFCARLAERVPLAVLESDVLRQVLFPVPTYSADESFRLFQAIHHLIEQLLKRGVRVVLDATNLSERYREYLYSIADRLSARLILVQVEAPPEMVQARLRRRVKERNGASEADWAVYERMSTTVEAIHRQHYVLDTSRDITPVLDKIVKEIER